MRVSGVPLSGLSLRQALDILRSSPAVTVLQVFVFFLVYDMMSIFFVSNYFNLLSRFAG